MWAACAQRAFDRELGRAVFNINSCRSARSLTTRSDSCSYAYYRTCNGTNVPSTHLRQHLRRIRHHYLPPPPRTLSSPATECLHSPTFLARIQSTEALNAKRSHHSARVRDSAGSAPLISRFLYLKRYGKLVEMTRWGGSQPAIKHTPSASVQYLSQGCVHACPCPAARQGWPCSCDPFDHVYI